MFKCKYCGKECKNKNSLAQHEIRCKNNSNRIDISKSINNFANYNKMIKECKIIKTYTNQFTKAKELGLPIPSVSEETRQKISESSKKQVWDDERRKRHSTYMLNAVKKNPLSYSCEFVNGRAPRINYNGIILNGKWEQYVAEYLDSKHIKWERPLVPFEYFWKNSSHLYYPDFYLVDYDVYIEVKGYERERDLCKWKVVPNLIVLKKEEIKKILDNKFSFYFEKKM